MSPEEIKKNTEGLNVKNIYVKHFIQSTGLCGPSSLRILLSYFGKSYSEEDLAKMAQATIGHGAEHEGMVAAIKAIDGYVFVKEDGTIEELEYFVKKEKLPVIIGWFDKDADHYQLPVGDHYSVVVNVTDKNIIIVDPAVDEDERWLNKVVFPTIW